MFYRIKKRIVLLLSLPKSLYVSLRMFRLSEAIRLPIIVRYNTRILDTKGHVTVIGGGKKGRVRIGFGGISEFDEVKQRSIIKFSGNITFTPPCSFGATSRIIVEKGAQLTIGKNFSNSANLTLSCRGNTTIGENVLVSWNTWICDTDFHRILNIKNNEISTPNGIIRIGNNIWICAHASVMKGASIPDGCIVASHAVVRNKIEIQDSLLAGIPAVVKNQNINYVK